MKKSIRNTTLLLSTCCILLACETAIEINVPFEKSSLVINSLINPDSVFEATISLNKFILDTNIVRDERKNAVVKIYEAVTNTFIEQLIYKEKPGDQYYTKKIGSYKGLKYPESGKTYKIVVDDLEYGQAQSTATVPDNISFKVVSVESSQLKLLGQDQVYVTPLHIEINDPANEKNFYHIRFSAKEYYINENKDTIWYASNHQEFYTNDLSIDKQDDFVDYMIFTDKLFNGKAKTLTLNLRNIRLSKITIIVTALSEEFYLYKTSYDVQYENDGNPFAQPVTVFTNISGGLGIFAGYKQSSKTFRINSSGL